MLAGYYGNTKSRINSDIGKKIENIRVLEKRLKRDYNFRMELKNKNIMDTFILNEGMSILNKVSEGLERLEGIDYLSLIKRSMKKNEICLGRVDEGNLRVLESIEIGSLKGVSYNLVEEDVYNYLKRIKRKDSKVDFNTLIREYVSLSYLSNESIEYISLLLLIPYDSLRQWYRYKVNKRNLTPSEYLENLKDSMEYEIYK